MNREIIHDFYVEKVQEGIELDVTLSNTDDSYICESNFIIKGHQMQNALIDFLRFFGFSIVKDSRFDCVSAFERDGDDTITHIDIEYYFSMDCEKAQELLKRFNEMEYGDKR